MLMVQVPSRWIQLLSLCRWTGLPPNDSLRIPLHRYWSIYRRLRT